MKPRIKELINLVANIRAAAYYTINNFFSYYKLKIHNKVMLFMIMQECHHNHI